MLLREIGKAWFLIRSLPKSLLFNLRYFPLMQAIRLPVLVSCHVKLMEMGGAVTVASNRFGHVKLGFQGSEVFPADGARGVWSLANPGRVSFGKNVQFGPGIRVHSGGALNLGNDIRCNGNIALFCAKHIRIGSGVVMAWDVTIMDHDFHAVLCDEAVINPPADVNIEDKVWLGADVMVLKGAHVARGTVVGARSLVLGQHTDADCVMAGTPARVIRKGISWQVTP